MRLLTNNPLWHGIYAASFAALVMLGAVYSAIALRNYQLETTKSFLKGQVALDVEHYYNENFIARDWGTSLWALINYSLFREGRVGVVIGNESWLYTLEEIKDYPNAAPELARNLDAIAHVHRYVKSHGTDLIVVLVPEKASVYPEYLLDKQPAPLHNTLYAQVMAGLQQREVTLVDTAPGLTLGKAQGDTFLKSDTHWTPFGAGLAAQQVARHLEQSPHASLLQQQQFITRQESAIKFQGDLLNFIPLGFFSRWIDVSSDQLVKTVTQQADTNNPGAMDGVGEMDLFGESTVAIALVGTSYSANPAWNFSGALKQHLGADLMNVAQEGKGPFVPMFEYLSSADFTQAPPQVLLWEIPVRFLPAHHGEKVLPSFILTTKGN